MIDRIYFDHNQRLVSEGPSKTISLVFETFTYDYYLPANLHYHRNLFIEPCSTNGSNQSLVSEQ